MTTTKTDAAKATPKTATKAEKAEKAPTMTIPTEPVKKDPNRVPQHNEDVPGFKPAKPDANAEDDATKDTLYPLSGRARWGNNDQAELMADSRKVDALIAKSEK